MNNRITLEFGDLDLLEQHAVIACDEGVEIDSAEVETVRTILEAAYAGKNFGLIANRANRYSVNPLAVRALFRMPKLAAGAIVGNSSAVEINARLESEIIGTRPIEYFTDLDQARHWIQDAIDNESKIS